MSTWEERPLGELCVSITDGDHQPPPKSDVGIPFITIKNIDANDNVLDFGDTAYVVESYYEKLKDERKPRPGDVLYSAVGSFGIPVLVQEEKPFVFQRHIAILRSRKGLDSHYLFYLMKSPAFYAWADAVAVGAAQRTVSLTQLRSKKIPVPPLDEQQQIAGVLAAYDKLIENNRKQIALLEEAAQRLYKEWFIDLHFPGYETTPIHDGLPEGWHCSTLGAEVTAVRGTSYSSDQLVDEGANSLVNLGNIQPFGGYRVGREKSFAGTGKPEQQVGFGDVIIGLTEQAAGLAGYAALVPTIDCKALISADLARLIPYVPGSEFYLYCSLRYGGLSRQLSPFASGTKIKHLKPADLALVGYVRPDELLLKKFCSVVKPLFSAIDILRQQSAAAREARDRLLPRLMSGEIQV